MAVRSGRRMGRLLQKLNTLVENKDFYEAHQTYRTVCARYLSQDLHQEAIQTAFDGAMFFLTNEQFGSGTDMACQLLKAYREVKLPVADDNLDRISKVLKLLDSESEAESRETVAHAAVEWSRTTDKEFSRHGHPRVHRVCALAFWRCKDFVTARWHFLHADSPTECAAMLVEFSCAQGHPSEVDLFLTQAVLNLLVLQKVGVARRVFESYTVAHPQIDEKQPPFLLPLLNFLWMLLAAVEQKLTEAFVVLRKKYAIALKRDASYNEFLDKIGTSLLGIPAANGGGFMGGFGDIFQSLFGAEESSDTASALEADGFAEEDID